MSSRGRTKLLSFFRNVRGDDFTERQDSWEHVVDLWGSIRPSFGRELIDGQQVTAVVTHVILCEFHETLEARLEMRFLGRRFGIVAVLDVFARARNIRMTAIERTPPISQDVGRQIEAQREEPMSTLTHPLPRIEP